MMRIELLIFVVALVAGVLAAPPPPPPGPPPHKMLGYAHVIEPKLSDDEHKKLDSLLESSRNETKGEIKAAVAKFVATLSAQLQVSEGEWAR